MVLPRLYAVEAEIHLRLPIVDEQKGKLLSFVRFQLVGERSRRTVVEDWQSLKSFESRASFENSRSWLYKFKGQSLRPSGASNS